MPWWASLIVVLVKEIPSIFQWVREHRLPNKEAVKEVPIVLKEAFKREGIGSPPDLVKE